MVRTNSDLLLKLVKYVTVTTSWDSSKESMYENILQNLSFK